MIDKIENKKKDKLLLGGLIAAGALIGSMITWILILIIFRPFSLPSQQTNGSDTQPSNYTSLTAPSNQPETTTVDQTSSAATSAATEATEPTETELDLSKQGERRIAVIAQKVLPSIAGIRVESLLPGTNMFAISEGSGVVYSSDGYIITNNHVISSVYDNSGRRIAGTNVYVYLYDDKTQYEAVIVGRDASTDLALLKISKTSLSPAEFGDSDLLVPGELAVAIGSPSGLQLMGSVTSGIISGLDRQVQLENGASMALIQTDAAVNTGNSGGALINEHGQVIGINNSGLVKSQFEGINFAIPANTTVEIIKELKKRPINAGQPWLGVSVIADAEYRELVELYNWPSQGVYIYEVQQDSPAELAGIKSGDIIISLNSSSVIDSSDFANQLRNFYAGQSIRVQIFRPDENKTFTLTAVLGETLS